MTLSIEALKQIAASPRTPIEQDLAMELISIRELKGEQVPVGYIHDHQLAALMGGNTTVVKPNSAFGETVELFTAPQKPTTEQMIEWLEGMEVSVDVSTGDADHGNRLFGKVTEVSELDGAKNGVILLVQEPEANFTAPQKPVVLLGKGFKRDIIAGMSAPETEWFSRKDVTAAIESAGGIVKDGE
ncbi:hypothetical protein [Rahnella inusitata]|uniref:hypothetical protein n=1 Tax=Rahnella inusitata TaxID=58169 RepID=UPI0039BEAFD4